MIIMYFTLFLFCNLFYSSLSANEPFILSFKAANGSIVYRTCALTVIPPQMRLPHNRSNADYSDVYYDKSYTLCAKSVDKAAIGRIIIVSDIGDCSLATKLKVASREMKAKMIVLAYTNFARLPKFETEIPVVLMRQWRILEQLTMSKHSAALYGVIGKDDKLVTVSVMAALVFFIIISIIICALTFHKEIFTQRQTELQLENNSKQLKWIIIILPLSMVTMLLLLYFFYGVMVYVMIFMYVWISAWITAELLMLPILKLSLFSRFVYPVHKFGIQNFDLRLFVLFWCAFSMNVVWFVYRKTLLGLVLNNVTGVLVCVGVSLQLGMVFAFHKKFKVIFTLLVMLVIFDAFMVYVPMTKKSMPAVLPFNTSMEALSRSKRASGSIMESVAIELSQSNSGEELPIRFKLPPIGYSKGPYDETCIQPGYSILGYGDLVIPGLYIVFLMLFAISFNSIKKKIIYAISVTFGYMLGMLLVDIVIIKTQSGQPALVFLLPCLLTITIITAAIYRPDLKLLWNESDWCIVPQVSTNHTELVDVTELSKRGDEETQDLADK